MALAPYPHNDAADENPSILVSNDGQHWSVPPGGSNPIERPAPHSHLADPSLFFDQISGELWLYYISEATHFTNVMRTFSTDGVHWSMPEGVIHAPDYQVVMPTVAKVGDQYWLWSVNAANAGCSASSTFVQYRTSPNGVNWSAPQLTDVAQPGYKIWHIGVTEVSPGNYTMLSSAYKHNCGHDDLFLALSQDGIHWTHFGRPLLTPSCAWDGNAIYKSSLAFDPKTDLMTVWYAALGGNSWHLGVTQGDFQQTLQELSNPISSDGN